MLPTCDSTISDKLIEWRGATAWRFPASRAFVYLIHFKTPYKHARHYLGYTTNIDARLAAHRHHNGSRLMEVITNAGISWELVRLWPVESCEQGHILERRLKRLHGSGQICPLCNPAHVAIDSRVQLRAGHYPFHLYSAPGRRASMGAASPMFVRREQHG